MRSLTWYWCIALGLAVLLGLSVAAAGPARADELSRLFAEIMRDPHNVELNMAYARLAEQRGQERKALAAYERVIAAHPDHAEAAAALHRIKIGLVPVTTGGKVEFGLRYESNPRELPEGFDPDDDIAGFVRLLVRDERPLFNHVWRSDLDGYADLHDRFEEIDFGRLRGHTGPVFELGGGATMHVAAGFGVAMLDGDYFYAEPAARLRFERLFGGWLDRLDIRGAFRDIDDSFRSDDGLSLDINALKIMRAALTSADAFLVQPFFRVREASGTGSVGGGPANFLDGDYIEAGARVGYFILLDQHLRVGASLTGHYRDYEQNIRFGTEEREDFYLAPEAEMLFRDIICYGCDIRLRYRYEENFSNDGTEDYFNHSVIASGIKRF